MSREHLSRWLADEEQTIAAGRELAASCRPGTVIYMWGQLGAGKTTLARGLLEAMGYSGTVKSPSYTWVETYEHLSIPVYHFDLYRLADPQELSYLGIDDYFHQGSVCMVEWPERGRGFLPEANISLELHPVKGSNGVIGRQLTVGRHSCESKCSQGEQSSL